MLGSSAPTAAGDSGRFEIRQMLFAVDTALVADSKVSVYTGTLVSVHWYTGKCTLVSVSCVHW